MEIDKSVQEMIMQHQGKSTGEFPLISFIMPVYNDGKSVKRAIESILDQDWPNKEVIAVNDGSTDDTKKVLDKLAKEHKNLTVLHLEKNKGACFARNEGTKLAKGKYFSYLPADSFFYPGMCRIWVETLERFPEYDFLYGGYRFVQDDGTPFLNYVSERFNPYLLESANYIDGSFPIKAETYWKVAKLMNQPDGLWDVSIKSLQDWDYWLSVVKEGKGRGLFYQDIFFETILPHSGGLSEDSHRNWLARTAAIKLKHKIPDRKICVTSPAAPFFGKYIAWILDADYKDMPPLKAHDYDMIYEIGFFPSIGEECGKVFIAPEEMGSYEEKIRKGEGVGYAPAVKVVHLIGTDLLQMQQISKAELRVFQFVLNSQITYLLTEFEDTQKEAKELGLYSEVVPIPPRRFYEITPFPKDFTVAVYAPHINESLYNIDLMEKVAKELPKVKFKLYGNPQKLGTEKNVECMGYVYDMDKLIADSSCLVRMTSHDGLPQGVLEFLSAGRRVIFNHNFPFVNTAKKQLTVDTIIKAIKEEMTKGVNYEAGQYIRNNFSQEAFKKKIYSLLEYRPKEFWEKFSEIWKTRGIEIYNTKNWDEIKPFIDKINPRSVIDIGCGEGQWSVFFDQEYLGLDISEKLIECAKERHPDKKFITTSLEDAPLKINKRYDMAFCYTLFEHITEDNMKVAVDALKKLAKVAIIIEPIKTRTKYYCHDHDYYQWFKIKKETILGGRKLLVVDL